MAQRADQQRRAAAPLGIRRAADVPAEPAVGAVALELAQELAASSGAQLDSADAVGAVPAMPRRADGDVLDAVAVEIPRGDDHAPVLLAGLVSRPVPELLPGGARKDAHLPRQRPGLVLRARRGDDDVALPVAVEIANAGEDAAEAAVRVGPGPSMQLRAGRGREDPRAADPRAGGILRGDAADGEI